jgi:hypothetical protein
MHQCFCSTFCATVPLSMAKTFWNPIPSFPNFILQRLTLLYTIFILYVYIYVSLYRCGSNIIFYSWGNCESNILAEKVHKEDEWATAPPPPSLSGYLLYMADWTQGPPSPFLSFFPMGYLCSILKNVYPNFKGTVFSSEPAYKKCGN